MSTHRMQPYILRISSPRIIVFKQSVIYFHEYRSPRNNPNAIFSYVFHEYFKRTGAPIILAAILLVDVAVPDLPSGNFCYNNIFEVRRFLRLKKHHFRNL